MSLLGLRRRPRDRRRLIFRQPTAAEIAAMPCDPPPDRDFLFAPPIERAARPKKAKAKAKPKIEGPGTQSGDLCRRGGCCGVITRIDDFALCGECGVHEI
jgi:hypothetical protein